MAVRNFVFRQNWVGRKVVGTKKKTFFPFLTQLGPPRFWPQKTQIRESLNSILVKTEIAISII